MLVCTARERRQVFHCLLGHGLRRAGPRAILRRGRVKNVVWCSAFAGYPRSPWSLWSPWSQWPPRASIVCKCCFHGHATDALANPSDQRLSIDDMYLEIRRVKRPPTITLNIIRHIPNLRPTLPARGQRARPWKLHGDLGK